MASTQESSAQQAFHWHYSQLDDRNFQIGGRTLFFVVLLFAIIITVTLLFLYARLVCRSTNLLPISDRHAPDPAVVTNLPITLHLSSSSGETECCICLGIIGEGEKVKVLPHCRHCYHSDCLDTWLFTHSTCPLCRVPLRVNAQSEQ